MVQKRSLARLVIDEACYRLVRALIARASRVGIFPTPLAVPLRDEIGQRIIATGSFELTQFDGIDEVFQRVDDVCRSGTFIDVGANIGLYSVKYAQRFRKVVAVEANPATAQILSANISMAGLDNVAIHAMGLSNKTGTMVLNVSREGFLGWSRFGSDMPIDMVPVEVEVTTLDSLVEARCPGERIVAIKIDVENHEPQVLEGAVRTLRAHRPILFYEALSGGAAEGSVGILREIGYDRFVTFRREPVLKGLRTGLAVRAVEWDPNVPSRSLLVCATCSA